MSHTHDWEIVSQNVTVSGTNDFDVSAPTGKVVVSGSVNAPSGAVTHESYPSASDTWHFQLSGALQTDVVLYVVCATT